MHHGQLYYTPFRILDIESCREINKSFILASCIIFPLVVLSTQDIGPGKTTEISSVKKYVSFSFQAAAPIGVEILKNGKIFRLSFYLSARRPPLQLNWGPLRPGWLSGLAVPQGVRPGWPLGPAGPQNWLASELGWLSDFQPPTRRIFTCHRQCGT